MSSGTHSATIPSDPAPQWPRVFGRYVLLAPIAQGGMGEICLALIGALQNAQRLCVIKTIRPEFAHEPSFIERFLDEGRMLCALTHPNIAQVLEVGIEGTTAFMALEHIAGVDLDALFHVSREQRSPLSCEFVVNLLAAVLDGMSFAHEARALDGTRLDLVHRDLSPQNLRLSWEGDLKVLDFGTAHGTRRSVKTAHGMVYGKPGYMSPEQCRGHALDARSDLFAIGIIAWEALCHRDFADVDAAAHMSALATGRALLAPLASHRTDVPPGFQAWLDKMTAYDREDRFASAAVARRGLFDLSRECGYILDREVLSSTVSVLFRDEREADRDHVRRLVGAAKTLRLATASDPGTLRSATTEPLPTSDQNLIHGTRYRIGARLGAGGMGEVFAAEHIDLGRTVAMKILYADQSLVPGVIQRFRLEARAIASLSHPNLVHIYDFGTTDDARLFYVMERLLGETLRDRLERLGRLPPAECVRIGIAVARGLAAAHAVSLVHRDIKPENIFLTQDGGVKVLDFGIAKSTNASLLAAANHGANPHATRQGEIFGSPSYMAPEQARGASDADARTDLYALGAVLYECASGLEVFVGASLVELLAQHLAEPPKPLSQRVPDAKIPAGYEAVVMRCLAKSPSDRPQSALELIAALEQCLSPAAAVIAPTRTAAARTGPRASPVPASKRWGPPLLALSGVVAVVAIFTASGRLSRTAPMRVEPAPRPPAALSAPTPPPPAPTPPPPAAPAPPAPTPPTPPTARQDSAPARPMDSDDAPPRAPPTASTSHFVLAQRAMEAGQYPAAIAQAEAAIAQGQGGQRARNLLGLAYMRSGRRSDAMRQWQMVLARDPENREAQRLLRMAGEGP